MYRFDPARRDLAHEFRNRPFGEHSPDLQYLLNLQNFLSVSNQLHHWSQEQWYWLPLIRGL